MTREDAIRWMTVLKQSKINWIGDTNKIAGIKAECEKAEQEAFDMAIEALAQDSRKVTQESDLISRQDAIKPFCIAPDGTRIPEVDCDNFPVEFSVEFIKKHLLSLPSADRPTGKWVECESNHVEKIYLCSNCQNYEAWGETEKTPYCPNCGAKMLKEDVKA